MGVFGDINRAEVMGNITQDLELRYTSAGTAVVNFSVATNRNYKSGDEWKEEVNYHNIVVWSYDAEQIAQRARKGTRVLINGRLQTRSWEGQDGKKNYRTEIVADNVVLIDRYEKMDKDGGGAPQNSRGSSQEQNNKSKSTSKNNSASDEDIIDPDDLPF